MVDRYPVRKPGPEFCAQVSGNGRQFCGRLIPIRRVPVSFTTRPLFEAEGKECEFDETN